MTTKILIVDDYDIVRRGLKLALQESLKDIETIEATSISSAILTLAEHPDIQLAILDLMLPGGDGRILIGHVLKYAPQAKIIMMSGRDDTETVNSAIEAGAHGFISKANSTEQMLEDIQLYMDGSMDHSHSRSPSNTLKSDPLDAYDLTPREKQITELIRQGMSNKEIGQTVYLSEGTVKNYLSVIYEKLQVTSRTQLLVLLN